MPSGVGTFTLYFGAFPGSNEASVNITGQAGVSATTPVEAFLMAEAAGTHTVSDATYAARFISLTCTAPAGSAFTVHARSEHKMQGQFAGRYVWAD